MVSLPLTHTHTHTILLFVSPTQLPSYWRHNMVLMIYAGWLRVCVCGGYIISSVSAPMSAVGPFGEWVWFRYSCLYFMPKRLFILRRGLVPLSWHLLPHCTDLLIDVAGNSKAVDFWNPQYCITLSDSNFYLFSLPIYLFIYLSACLSVCICLSIYLSI